MTKDVFMQLLPIYSLVAIMVMSAGLGFYPFKKSVAQANAIAVLVGCTTTLNLKTNLIYGQSPYIVIMSLITIIFGLIIVNIVIATKSSNK